MEGNAEDQLPRRARRARLALREKATDDKRRDYGSGHLAGPEILGVPGGTEVPTRLHPTRHG